MKAYWDSSALVHTALDAALRARLIQERAFTRTHALSEIFSTFTGKANIRMEANAAVAAIKALAHYLDFVDLTSQEVLDGLARARQLGVRGGRVHDYMHALAAEKSGAKSLLTLDRHDFVSLVPGLSVEQV